MTRTLAALLLSATPALADGLGDPPAWTDPCAEPFPSFDAYATTVHGADPVALYALAAGLRDAACGDVLPEAALREWTPEMARFVFPGDPLPPAPVPLPAGGWMMLAALAAMWRMRCPR